MGKKKQRDTQVSNGERRSVRKDICKMARREYLASGQQMINKLDAWKKGKRATITIPNPEKSATNRPFIKMTMDEFMGCEYKHMKKFKIGG